MTIGDVDTIANFIKPLTAGTLPFPVMTFAVLIVVLLMMPILLNNLLVSAESNYSSIMNNQV